MGLSVVCRYDVWYCRRDMLRIFVQDHAWGRIPMLSRWASASAVMEAMSLLASIRTSLPVPE